MIYKVS